MPPKKKHTDSAASSTNINMEALGKAVMLKLNDLGRDEEWLANTTYRKGNPAEHKRAVDRICGGNGSNSKDKTVARVIAEELSIELEFQVAGQKKSPFGHAKKPKGGRGRGGTKDGDE